MIFFARDRADDPPRRAAGSHVHGCPACHADVPCLWQTCSIEPELSGPGEPRRGFYTRCDACRAKYRGIVVGRNVRGEHYVAPLVPKPDAPGPIAVCTSIEAAHAAARLLAGMCDERPGLD